MNHNLRKSEIPTHLINNNKPNYSKDQNISRSYVSTDRLKTQIDKMAEHNRYESIIPVQSQLPSLKDYKQKYSSRSRLHEDGISKYKIVDESDSKKIIDNLRRQVQSKDNKIKELTMKCNYLYNKLKYFLNDNEINMEIQGFTDDNQKKIKRLQNLLRIKNQQIFFKIKIQASNLLQEFQVDKTEIAGINQIQNQNSIFQFLISKLKIKLKDFKMKQRQTTQQLHKDRLLQQRNEQTIHFLTQTNEILKNSQARTKQKLQDLKHEWAMSCEKLSKKQKELQQKDNELFKIKKLYEQTQNNILKNNANERHLNSLSEQSKREYESNIRELRTLLTNYNLQKKQLLSYLEQRQSTIEQMSIREKYNQEQFEKINREYTRWRERYEWLQKQKQSRIRNYEQQLNMMVSQFQEYKQNYNSEILQKLINQRQLLNKDLQHYKMSCIQLQEQIKKYKQNKLILEDAYYKKIQALQTDYIKKYQTFQQNKQSQIQQIIQSKQQSQLEKIKQNDQKWNYKFQQQQAHWNSQLTQIQKLYLQKFTKLIQQNQQSKSIIHQLNTKLSKNIHQNSKDKLIIQNTSS